MASAVPPRLPAPPVTVPALTKNETLTSEIDEKQLFFTRILTFSLETHPQSLVFQYNLTFSKPFSYVFICFFIVFCQRRAGYWLSGCYFEGDNKRRGQTAHSRRPSREPPPGPSKWLQTRPGRIQAFGATLRVPAGAPGRAGGSVPSAP